MGKKHLSTFVVTSGLKEMEAKFLCRTNLSATQLYENAIFAFYNSDDWEILPELLITKKSHPDYVKRDAVDRVYLSDEMSSMLREIADYNKCKDKSTVFFQSVMNYVINGLQVDGEIKGIRTGDTVTYTSDKYPNYTGKDATAVDFDLVNRCLSLLFYDGRIIVANIDEIVYGI